MSKLASMEDPHRINLIMPRKLASAMTTLADRRGTSFSQLVRQACLDHLRHELPKMRDEQEATGRLQPPA
jgi:hypothetical protein